QLAFISGFADTQFGNIASNADFSVIPPRVMDICSSGASVFLQYTFTAYQVQGNGQINVDQVNTQQGDKIVDRTNQLTCLQMNKGSNLRGVSRGADTANNN